MRRIMLRPEVAAATVTLTTTRPLATPHKQARDAVDAISIVQTIGWTRFVAQSALFPMRPSTLVAAHWFGTQEPAS